MRNRWKTIVIAAVVAALGLSVVAAAYGATQNGKKKGNGTIAAACAQLMNNPQAVQDMQALRAEHQKDMQAWWQQYGSNPTSAEAQAALKALRQEHWNDMKALFAKYGVQLPANAGPGSLGGYGMMGGGYGMMGGGCGMGGGGCGTAGSGAGAGACGAGGACLGNGAGAGTATGYGMMGGGASY